MRTTLDIDGDLMKRALRESGIPTKTKLVEEGIRMILRHQAYQRLAALGGSMKGLKAPRRRRFK